MTAPIDFYFDFSSPYGYFAATRIDALAAKYGRTVRWHPILLGVVFKTTGSAPLPTIPIKGKYSVHDMERTARFHGIPYRFPDKFPLATQLAARATLWAKQTFGEQKAAELALAIYRAYFVDGVNIMEPEPLVALAKTLGIDGTAMIEAASATEIKDRLRAEVDAAMVRGVFGSPYIVVDGEPFWGFDRFDQIEYQLKHGSI